MGSMMQNMHPVSEKQLEEGDDHSSSQVVIDCNTSQTVSIESEHNPAHKSQQANRSEEEHQKKASAQGFRKHFCGPNASLWRSFGGQDAAANVEDSDTTGRLFYDLKGYQNVLSKLQASKKYQDTLCKILKARSRIEKIYADSLKKWHTAVEKETKNLELYHHERLFLDMILSRDSKVSTACSNLSSQMIDISETLHKKSDIFFGPSKYGSLENVKDLSSKFRVAQKHWMTHLIHLEAARNHLANQSIDLARMRSKYSQMVIQNPNLQAPENKRMEEKINEAQNEQVRLNKRYTSLFTELDVEKDLYVSMMAEQYQTFLGIEKKRFQFTFFYLHSYFQKLEFASNEIAMASLYKDMKAALDEFDPALDYQAFCVEKGAHSDLKLPIQEDIVAEINKASEEKSAIATTASQTAKSGTKKGTKTQSLNIETTVGKSSGMKFEAQEPHFDFTVEKSKESMVQKNQKAIDQYERLSKDNNIHPDKSLAVAMNDSADPTATQ